MADYTVSAIRGMSFGTLNALDNYYHLIIIAGNRVEINFPRVILNAE
jgi:hypothetical protein